MSYSVATPQPKTRPGTVTAARWLLYLSAVLLLVSALASLATIGPVKQVIDDELAKTPGAPNMGGAVIAGVVIGLSVSTIFAIGLAVLGALIGRGSNAARIVTWVVGGLGVLCQGCGLASNALQSSLTSLSSQSNPDSAEFQQRIRDAMPAWQTSVALVISLVVLLALLAVVILLALPASNDFFRRQEEVWVPPGWSADAPPLPPPAPPYGHDGPRL
jgi:hypothetical protein